MVAMMVEIRQSKRVLVNFIDIQMAWLYCVGSTVGATSSVDLTSMEGGHALVTAIFVCS